MKRLHMLSAQALKREEGIVVIVTALLIAALLLISALSINTGYVAVAKSELQRAADAAALAGAQQLCIEQSCANNALAVSENLLEQNEVLGKFGRSRKTTLGAPSLGRDSFYERHWSYNDPDADQETNVTITLGRIEANGEFYTETELGGEYRVEAPDLTSQGLNTLNSANLPLFFNAVRIRMDRKVSVLVPAGFKTSVIRAEAYAQKGQTVDNYTCLLPFAIPVSSYLNSNGYPHVPLQLEGYDLFFQGPDPANDAEAQAQPGILYNLWSDNIRFLDDATRAALGISIPDNVFMDGFVQPDWITPSKPYFNPSAAGTFNSNAAMNDPSSNPNQWKAFSKRFDAPNARDAYGYVGDYYANASYAKNPDPNAILGNIMSTLGTTEACKNVNLGDYFARFQLPLPSTGVGDLLGRIWDLIKRDDALDPNRRDAAHPLAYDAKIGLNMIQTWLPIRSSSPATPPPQPPVADGFCPTPATLADPDCPVLPADGFCPTPGSPGADLDCDMFCPFIGSVDFSCLKCSIPLLPGCPNYCQTNPTDASCRDNIARTGGVPNPDPGTGGEPAVEPIYCNARRIGLRDDDLTGAHPPNSGLDNYHLGFLENFDQDTPILKGNVAIVTQDANTGALRVIGSEEVAFYDVGNPDQAEIKPTLRSPAPKFPDDNTDAEYVPGTLLLPPDRCRVVFARRINPKNYIASVQDEVSRLVQSCTKSDDC